MKYLLLVMTIIALIGADSSISTGRGAGYRTDYATGRSEWRGKKEPHTFLVARVVDGDTLRIDREKVRLIGVDTPETRHPTKPVQYFGKEASLFTQREVEHRMVTLDYDVQKRDKYGRLLAYVHRATDRFFLNAELVKQGYGFAYTRFPFKYMNAFREYEKQARSEGKGLWQRDKKEPEQQPKPLEPEIITPVAPSVAIKKKEPEPVAEDKSADCKIKGNINHKGEKMYHLPGGRWYDKTKVDETEGEQWFCTEAEAEKAGWRKAGS